MDCECHSCEGGSEETARYREGQRRDAGPKRIAAEEGNRLDQGGVQSK
jgi:hypothetical protein